MATLRSILHWRVVAVTIFCAMISLGAAFAPWGPSFLKTQDPMRGSFPESGFVSSRMETKFPSGCGAISGRLGELTLTHRAVSVSA